MSNTEDNKKDGTTQPPPKNREGGNRARADAVAVALEYDSGSEFAPKVIAGGRGKIAEQILQIAFERGIKVREDADLAALFEQYGLCEEYGNPDIINDIPPADALTITNTLHQLLEFKIGEDGMISPWAPDDDIIAACELTDSEAAISYCDQLESRCDQWGNCIDIGYIPSEEAVTALVPALNQLYGITSASN